MVHQETKFPFAVLDLLASNVVIKEVDGLFACVREGGSSRVKWAG